MNGLFTVEESNLICIYSSKDRQKALDGLYHVLSVTEDSEMTLLICSTIDKLSTISDAKFASLNLVAAEE